MEFPSAYPFAAAYAHDNRSVLDLYPDLPMFQALFNDTLNGSCLFNDTGCNGTTPANPQGPISGVLIPLIYIVVCIIGLGGNTLVIHIVLHYSKTESVTNIYILNLAIADELFMLGLPFLAVQGAMHSWPFGSLMCRLVMTVDAINQFTSIFCLTVMSVDRYLAVVHPIRSSKWRRPQVAKVVNATVWLLSFTVVLPVVVFAGVHHGHCNIIWPQPESVWRAAFIIFTSIVGFFLPLLVICLCYLLIVFKIRSSGKKVHATSTKRRKSERKVTRMVVIVVAVFVLCWLPFYALNILNLMVQLPDEPKGLYYFVVVLLYTNSCANPIIYGFMSDNFKRGFRKALCRSSRRVDNHDTTDQHRRQLQGEQQHQQQQQQQEQQEEQEELQRRRHMLKPRESLRRGVRGHQEEEEEDDDEDQEEVTEMTEICKITQNGNGNVSRQQAETSCALLSDKVAATELSHEFVSPDGRGMAAGDGGPGKAPGFGPPVAMPSLLHGAKNGSVKPLPEEPVEKNTLLEISYL
ncbi:somatostatin receptor type 5-like [Clupea harengus]|uniref:Somatostatin receptor type 5-like n=1 Tax=Clupea harengus TaxID=7950 RepID=A0A6P8G1L5_CLUHA|nr:somatostatin receptor type 5-like [Clupea harengus]